MFEYLETGKCYIKFLTLINKEGFSQKIKELNNIFNLIIL